MSDRSNRFVYQPGDVVFIPKNVTSAVTIKPSETSHKANPSAKKDSEPRKGKG